MPIITVEATIDSEINPTDATGNFGDLDLILMGLQFAGGDKLNLWRPIANFDVSALIGNQINDAKLVHFSYRHYLENVIRRHFGFDGVALRLSFRSRKER